MNRDGHYRNPYPELVNSFDSFLVNTALPDEDISIPLEHQPPNPENEDEVPNQEAVNGIARAKRPKPPAWRDLGLNDLVTRVPIANVPGERALGDRLKSLNMQSRSEGVDLSTLRTLR